LNTSLEPVFQISTISTETLFLLFSGRRETLSSDKQNNEILAEDEQLSPISWINASKDVLGTTISFSLGNQNG
jgi:hypothetical protein